MVSNNRHSAIESTSAFTAKIEDLVKEIVIQNNILYYRIESSVEHVANTQGEDTFMPVIRVITYFEDTVNQIADLLNTEFDVIAETAVDKKKSRMESFSYKHIQFLVGLKQNRRELTEYKRSGDKKFEIQICSMLQDAWAGIEKELGYDSASFPEEGKRDLYRVGALLEMADLEFLKIRSKFINLPVPAPAQTTSAAVSAPAPQPKQEPVQEAVMDRIPEPVYQPEVQPAPVAVAEEPVFIQPEPPKVEEIPLPQYYVPQAPSGIAPKPAKVEMPEPVIKRQNIIPEIGTPPVSARVEPQAIVAEIPVPPTPVQVTVIPPAAVHNAPVSAPAAEAAMPVAEHIAPVIKETPAPVAEAPATPQAAPVAQPAAANAQQLAVNVAGSIEQQKEDSGSAPFFEDIIDEQAKAVSKPMPLDENAPITDTSLKEYVMKSKLLREIDKQIAERAGARINSDIDIEGDVERLRFLKVYTLKQLHDRLKDNQDDIVAFAEKWIGKDNGGSFDSGISLFYLEYLLVGKRNDPAFAVEYVVKFISDNDYSARYIIPTYNSIRNTEAPNFSHLTLK